ncbi:MULTISPECIES: hypothetical protein [Streptococcus]|uniref:Sporulation protein Cse60 n=1 Tax=Streptococcus dysgalactiae subsp. equisimilis TaxID=119602 RepID=A0AAE9QRN7_STREQ|nr:MULTISPECIES: hypothetical protein [Streptococcus]QBX07685.1 hypothetical protein JavanS167_0003 [Streptococcus satellite phage Javan167]MDW7796795.1 hypothetical protein [Streptococcus canis]VDZ41445.1 Uncharacterised protein [Streptococcus dysgalactiae subsp. dysgalactiae]VHK62916.1 Uncharacterised protein [Streptococcus pyogenes]VTT17570.1 Uncharacterised protein [Streptococcus dysgalactiae]
MKKIKLFVKEDRSIEEDVNTFIEDKNVVDIDFQVATSGSNSAVFVSIVYEV